MTLPDDDHLPELPAEALRALELALRSAWSPGELDPARHAQILEAALEDPFAPASPEELAESERFRQALEGRADHPDLELARALKVAHDASPLSELSERRIAKRTRTVRSSRLYFGSFGVTAVLAVAAAFALWNGSSAQSSRVASDPALYDLAQSRSTAPLFSDASPATASARIDRIADLRTRELRDNRYAAWGVR